MALYVPAGRRRRNLVLGLAAALVLGLLVGVVVGRVSAPSVADKVSTVQDAARAVTARLQATPIEYQKQLAGSSEFRRGGTVVQSLTDAQASLRAALDDAVWLGPTQRREASGALGALVTAARARVAPARYQQLVDSSARRIDVVFGVR